MLSGSMTEDKLSHPPKALDPMLVTLLGISMELRLEQCANAFSLIDVMLSGRTTDFKLRHSSNTEGSIDVTPLGITIEDKLVQPEKA